MDMRCTCSDRRSSRSGAIKRGRSSSCGAAPSRATVGEECDGDEAEVVRCLMHEGSVAGARRSSWGMGADDARGLAHTSGAWRQATAHPLKQRIATRLLVLRLPPARAVLDAVVPLAATGHAIAPPVVPLAAVLPLARAFAGSLHVEVLGLRLIPREWRKERGVGREAVRAERYVRSKLRGRRAAVVPGSDRACDAQTDVPRARGR